MSKQVEEYCRNCGMAKFMHVDFDKYLGKPIDSMTYDALLADAVEKRTLFGNVCLDWKRDNLRFLEGLSAGK